MKSQRSPQLSLRLDSASPDIAARWHDGACIAYLGGILTLQLDTDRKTAMLDGEILHLPLPPAATPRQIQDGTEAWLRQEAARLIDASLTRHAKRLECSVPRWALSFAARGGWVQHRNDDLLRFNWRLIEQTPALVDQIVGSAVAALPGTAATADFWGMQAT